MIGYISPICVSLGVSSLQTLITEAEREVESGESFLEFCLEYLANPWEGVRAVRKFLRNHTQTTILVTCRRNGQTHFKGTLEQQLGILEAAVDAGAHALDIEFESAQLVKAWLATMRAKAYVIVSYHDYKTTPSTEVILHRMKCIRADAYKIVTTALKPSDVLRVLGLFAKDRQLPKVAFSMGAVGFSTRVLSLSAGSLFTYAAPKHLDGTAPGQMSADRLRDAYSVGRFTESASKYGAIGHTLPSPLFSMVQNRAFCAKSMDAVHIPIVVRQSQLRDFFAFARRLPLKGFQIVQSFGPRLQSYVVKMDSISRQTGVVDTVCKKAGEWRGFNLQGTVIVEVLKLRMPLSKSSILITGNGSVALIAACALRAAGSRVSLLRGTGLAGAGGHFESGRLSIKEAESRRYDAIIRAPDRRPEASERSDFFSGDIPADIVLDLGYERLETGLTRRAVSQGKVAISAAEVLLERAKKQFEMWTEENAPCSVMEQAVREFL